MNSPFDSLQNTDPNPFAAMATGFDPNSFEALSNEIDSIGEKAPKKLVSKAESAVVIGGKKKNKNKRRNKPAMQENMMGLLEKLPVTKLEPPKQPKKMNSEPVVDCSHLDFLEEPSQAGKKNRKVAKVEVEETYDNEEEKKVAEQYDKQVEAEIRDNAWVGANHLLGTIKEDEEEKSMNAFAFSGLAASYVKKKTNSKPTGYSKMAKRNRCGSLGLSIDNVQATMRFVVVNAAEDGGCELNHDGHFDEELDELRTKGLWRDLTGSESDYVEAFYDANQPIPWQSVVKVSVDQLNSTESQCPICMESLSEMVCPRITQCGHIFCWSCILAYIDYDSVKHSKKCPLCPENIYRLQLKPVEVRVATQYSSGDVLTFDLMVRNKANCVVKNKYHERLLLSQESLIQKHKLGQIHNRLPGVVVKDKPLKLPEQGKDEEFPSLLVDSGVTPEKQPKPAAPSMDEAYSQSRVLMNTEMFYRQMLNADMEALLLDLDSKKSWGEEEMALYVQEAIETVDAQLHNLNLFEAAKNEVSPVLKSESSSASKSTKTSQQFVSIKSQQLADEKQSQLEEQLSATPLLVEESNGDSAYFYQVSTGERLFLDPTSMKWLVQQFDGDFQKFPLRFEAKVEHLEFDILDLQSGSKGPHRKLKSLAHLPDTTPFGLVECDLNYFISPDVAIVESDGQSKQQPLLSKDVYSEHSKVFENRKRARKRHQQAEDEYNKQVGKFRDQAFNEFKAMQMGKSLH